MCPPENPIAASPALITGVTRPIEIALYPVVGPELAKYARVVNDAAQKKIATPKHTTANA